MKILLLASLAWLLPTPAPSPRPADGLKRERLPADVDFVVHLDLEGLKRTELWKQAAASTDQEELQEGLAELAEIKARFGVDPLTDVRAVTLFKVKQEEEPTVVLFSTTPQVDEALRVLKNEPGYARLSEGGIELHTWQEGGDADDERAFAYLHSGPGEERVVVLAGSKASTLRAARVLRGEEPNHAKHGALLNLAPASGSFLYLAAADLGSFDEFQPASQVFGLARGMQLDLGEAGGYLRAHLGLTTGSPDDAVNVANVVNGLVSLARLAGSEAGELLELLTGIRMNTRGSEVTLDFEFDVQRLLQILAGLEGG